MQELLDKGVFHCGVASAYTHRLPCFLVAYNQPHRRYHTLDHIKTMVDRWISSTAFNKMSPDDREIFYFAVLFHDIVYNPFKSNNEEKSCEIFRDFAKTVSYDDLRANAVCRLIMATKSHNDKLPDYSGLINYYDCYDLLNPVPHTLIKNELLLFKEFQKFSIEQYRKGRIDFLTKWAEGQRRRVRRTIAQHVTYIVEEFKPRVGVYAGTFNPFHIGHNDILKKAEKVFDKVIIACCRNPDKTPNEEIYNAVRAVLPVHEVVSWDGLLTDLCKDVKKDYGNVSIVRGYRSGFDIDSELRNIRVMEDLANEEINVVHFPSSRDLEHVSSSVVRGLQKFPNSKELLAKYRVSEYAYLEP